MSTTLTVTDEEIGGNESSVVTEPSKPFGFIQPIITQVYKLDPSTSHWYSGQVIPVNDPLIVKFGEYNNTIELLNYSMYDLVDVVVLFEMTSMKTEKYEIFRTSIKALEHLVIETGIMDKDSESRLTVEVEDPRYKKLQAIDVCWKVSIPMSVEYGGVTHRHTVKDVKSLMMSITNIAYTLASPEMEKTFRNWEAVTGKKFKILPEYKDNSSKTPSGVAPKDMYLDLSKDEDLNRLYRVMGVHNTKYAGPQKSDSFVIGVIANNGGVGKAVTWGFWNNPFSQLGQGYKMYIREKYMNFTKNYGINYIYLHELGHVFGFNHYSSFCYGEAADYSPRTIETVLNLLSEELPYWNELPNYGKPRVGGNDYERYCINHPDFIPKFYDKLMLERDARNAECRRFNKSKSSTGVWFIDNMKNQNLLKTIHPADKDTYDQTININIFSEL